MAASAALLVGALLAAGYSISVYAMAASFSVSNPEHLEYWRRTASVYGASALGCLVLAVVGAVLLIRSFCAPG